MDALRTQARQPNARRSTNVGSYGPYTIMHRLCTCGREHGDCALAHPHKTIGFTLPYAQDTRRRCRHRLVASSTMANRGHGRRIGFHERHCMRRRDICKSWASAHTSAAVITHLPLAWAWAWATCRTINPPYSANRPGRRCSYS